MCKNDVYQINDQEVLRHFREIAEQSKGKEGCWIQTNGDVDEWSKIWFEQYIEVTKGDNDLKSFFMMLLDEMPIHYVIRRLKEIR